MMFDHDGQGSSGLFQRQAAPADNLAQRGPLQTEDHLCCGGADGAEMFLQREQQQLTQLVAAVHFSYLEDITVSYNLS